MKTMMFVYFRTCVDVTSGVTSSVTSVTSAKSCHISQA